MSVSEPDIPEIMRVAREAASRAYAPYSDFHVGAAILTTGGAVYGGSNVENASYGLAICAERNAATTMAYTDPDDRSIRLVAIYSPDASPCFPCGACRQVLREFDCQEVVVEGKDGAFLSYAFEEILPHSFGPESL
ncbi:MAG: cytidine deaminase [Rubrobacter sp.]